jgi:putative hydrolase of the HAD superfamily
MLGAIFFDIDDTLYSTSNFAARARNNSIAALIKTGLDLPRDIVSKELSEIITEFSSNYEQHYDKLLLRVPYRCYEGINPAILTASAVVAYHQTKFRELKPYPDVLAVLKILARTDLIRGVITSGLAIKQAEKIIRLKIYHLLTPRAIFISDQIGINKPNIKLYQRACSDLNIQPSEAMYVGDNPLTDIDPPNRLGMITVQSKRSGKYTALKGKTKPRYQINNFWELLTILKKDFNLKTPIR